MVRLTRMREGEGRGRGGERERERERGDKRKARALRAHTPRAPCNCVIVQLGHAVADHYLYTYKV